eukprot:3828959-Prymnesium_polylepis.1
MTTCAVLRWTPRTAAGGRFRLGDAPVVPRQAGYCNTNRPKKHRLIHVRDAPGVRARQRERRAATPRSHDLP